MKSPSRELARFQQGSLGTMTDKYQEKPKLIFFRETPKDLLTRPPLASSLQHLETSFLLIALRRYPHALVSCASAIESAIKATFNTGQGRKQTFQTLLDRAQKEFPSYAKFARTDIDEFRKKRNEIIHYGFSPKDDEISAVLLLKTGYQLIEQCYQTFFEFPLKRSGEKYGGLLPELDHQLDIARKVYLKAKTERGLNLTYCFIAFAHEIRWRIQPWMMSDWQQEILDSEEDNWAAWEFKRKQKEELTCSVLDPSWHFDCPVCGDPDSFICELDDNQLDNGKVSLKRGACVNCGLVIPKNCPFLADNLCAEQFDEARPKILKEYGIT